MVKIKRHFDDAHARRIQKGWKKYKDRKNSKKTFIPKSIKKTASLVEVSRALLVFTLVAYLNAAKNDNVALTYKNLRLNMYSVLIYCWDVFFSKVICVCVHA